MAEFSPEFRAQIPGRGIARFLGRVSALDRACRPIACARRAHEPPHGGDQTASGFGGGARLTRCLTTAHPDRFAGARLVHRAWRLPATPCRRRFTRYKTGVMKFLSLPHRDERAYRGFFYDWMHTVRTMGGWTLIASPGCRPAFIVGSSKVGAVNFNKLERYERREQLNRPWPFYVEFTCSMIRGHLQVKTAETYLICPRCPRVDDRKQSWEIDSN